MTAGPPDPARLPATPARRPGRGQGGGLDDDEDFTAEHVGPGGAAGRPRRVAPPQAPGRRLGHAGRLLLLRPAALRAAARPRRGPQPLPGGQPDPSQHRPDAVPGRRRSGRTIDATSARSWPRPRRRPRSPRGSWHSEWLGEDDPGAPPSRSVHSGRVVAVIARESASARRWPSRGELDRTYLEVFDRLARMVAVRRVPLRRRGGARHRRPPCRRRGDPARRDGAGRVRLAQRRVGPAPPRRPRPPRGRAA